MSLRRGIKGR
ncbi:hypothetical protein BAE44_0001208 [Dichanthelium oligosanthes]|uniref:Uncharacterized protein n=1 Tax=Dichanthelium oligosanthes TaxID=888268 RepID=A0A1E5WK24_9POAL|nr:hypothetical protein BAE44_0001208 [Dichanthelium oligosanthes]